MRRENLQEKLLNERKELDDTGECRAAPTPADGVRWWLGLLPGLLGTAAFCPCLDGASAAQVALGVLGAVVM